MIYFENCEVKDCEWYGTGTCMLGIPQSNGRCPKERDRRELSMQKDIEKQQKLHEKELKLLEFIRRLGYGEILIKVQDGLPVMVERATEKIKL